MIADPRRYRKRNSAFRTLFLTVEEFYRNESFAKRLDKVLWHGFHAHGKYAWLSRHAEYVVVAIDKNKQYIASGLIIPVGPKWTLEYVITDPKHRGKGGASAVLDRTMREAKKQQLQWVILNCNPKKLRGQLPAFYANFGFKTIL